MSQSYSTSHNWKRLVRFIAKEDDRIYAGEPLNENIDGTFFVELIKIYFKIKLKNFKISWVK